VCARKVESLSLSLSLSLSPFPALTLSLSLPPMYIYVYIFRESLNINLAEDLFLGMDVVLKTTLQKWSLKCFSYQEDVLAYMQRMKMLGD
jgi:hypothetical protein